MKNSSLNRVLMLTLLMVSMIGFFSFTPIRTSTKLDFTLVNKTGYGLSKVYVAPSDQESWGDDILEGKPLKDGESIDIEFDRTETAANWDLMVNWVGYDEPVYWRKFNLSKINKITLHYNEKTEKTTATTE
jgi:hypothetical protein